MQKLKSLLWVTLILFVFTNQAIAQDEEITDEELKRYAVTMDSVDAMKKSVNVTVNAMIKENEALSGKRYLAISKVIDNEEKLKSLEATDEEIAGVKVIVAKTDELKAAINKTFQTMAKEYIGDGGRTYKKIKAAIKSDADVKARYQEILAEVKSKDEGTD